MTVEILFIALVLAVFTVLFIERSSFEGSAVFVLLSITHYFTDFSGYGYYFSAALFDLIAVCLLNFVTYNKTIYYLQLIALTSIILNFLGWVIWFFYFPPLAYDLAHTILYIIAVLVILRRGFMHGVFTFYNWCVSIRANHSKGDKRNIDKEVEA